MAGVANTPTDGKWWFTGSAAALVPLLLALWLASQWGWRDPGAPEVSGLQAVALDSAAELAVLFNEHGYRWPPAEPVPRLSVQQLPADLAQQTIPRKKALFFKTLLPLVLAENQRLEEKRAWLEGLDLQGLAADEAERFAVLLERYRIEDSTPAEQRAALLQRVDRVPVALVLAQAANESGWGTSRFVREANNLFGEWTWRAEEGIAPRIRNADSRHYVRRFDNLEASVRAYIYNLNVGHAYEELRTLRAAMRAEGLRPYDAQQLASGLERYSERGEEYVTEIQQMIRSNRLHRLGMLELSAP